MNIPTECLPCNARPLPPSGYADDLARWMQDEAHAAGFCNLPWDALEESARDRIRHVARALLHRPPDVLLAAMLAGGITDERGA